MDAEYKQMMTWVVIALVVSVLAAVIIVELVVRRWAT
jgi:ABC-type Mn2+/Zn2+ transport system permease subunit